MTITVASKTSQNLTIGPVTIGNETDIVDIVPLSGAVGIWHLDEGTGGFAYDASPNGNTGTLTNSPTWTTGKFGNALSFASASSQYVSIPISTSLNSGITSAFSISFWVNFTSLPTSGNTMGLYSEWSSVPTANGFDFLLYNNSGTMALDLITSNAGGTTGIINNWSPSLSTWYHVVVTYNSSTIYFYVNGVSIGNATAGVATVGASTTANTIGFDQYASSYLNGKMDEIRIYSRVLSTAEITQLYSEGGESGDFIVESLLDLSSMVSGDTTVVTEYTAVDDVNSHIYQQTTYSGAQSAPLLRFHGKIFYKNNLYRITLKQTGGAGRSYPVSSIMQMLSS